MIPVASNNKILLKPSYGTSVPAWITLWMPTGSRNQQSQHSVTPSSGSKIWYQSMQTLITLITVNMRKLILESATHKDMSLTGQYYTITMANASPTAHLSTKWSRQWSISKNKMRKEASVSRLSAPYRSIPIGRELRRRRRGSWMPRIVSSIRKKRHRVVSAVVEVQLPSTQRRWCNLKTGLLLTRNSGYRRLSA